MATQQSTTKKSPSKVTGKAGWQDDTMPVRDETYGLVSVTYHALQGAETYAQYQRDAEKAGDQELSAFFKQCGQEEASRAERAKGLLAMRLGGGLDDGEDDQDEVEDEDDEDEDDEEENA